MSFEHRAVDRNFFAGLHPQAIPHHHLLQGNLLVRAVIANAMRRLWREFQQRAYGAGGVFPRAQLQHLAQKHEHSDHRGRLEIQRHHAGMMPKCLRKDSRREKGNDAVAEGHTNTEHHQRVHIEVARSERLPPAHKKGQRRPRHHRDGQDKLRPAGECRTDKLVDMQPRNVLGHCEDKNRQSQHQTNPEAPRHVDQLWIGPGLGARRFRLERHAALRAVAGADLTHLGMHRAGEHCSGRRGAFRRLNGVMRVVVMRIVRMAGC